MLTGRDPITRGQLRRIYGTIRVIVTQLYGYETAIDDFKLYIKLLACEEGYPYTIENGIVYPASLGTITQADANIINIVLNRYADEHNLYVIQVDELGEYKSIGGRDRAAMLKDFPEGVLRGKGSR
jgi:hypothetical protein